MSSRNHEKNFDKKIWIDNEKKRCDFYSPSEMHDSAVEDDFTGVSLWLKISKGQYNHGRNY